MYKKGDCTQPSPPDNENQKVPPRESFFTLWELLVSCVMIQFIFFGINLIIGLPFLAVVAICAATTGLCCALSSRSFRTLFFLIIVLFFFALTLLSSSVRLYKHQSGNLQVNQLPCNFAPTPAPLPLTTAKASPTITPYTTLTTASPDFNEQRLLRVLQEQVHLSLPQAPPIIVEDNLVTQRPYVSNLLLDNEATLCKLPQLGPLVIGQMIFTSFFILAFGTAIFNALSLPNEEELKIISPFREADTDRPREDQPEIFQDKRQLCPVPWYHGLREEARRHQRARNRLSFSLLSALSCNSEGKRHYFLARRDLGLCRVSEGLTFWQFFLGVSGVTLALSIFHLSIWSDAIVGVPLLISSLLSALAWRLLRSPTPASFNVFESNSPQKESLVAEPLLNSYYPRSVKEHSFHDLIGRRLLAAFLLSAAVAAVVCTSIRIDQLLRPTTLVSPPTLVVQEKEVLLTEPITPTGAPLVSAPLRTVTTTLPTTTLAETTTTSTQTATKRAGLLPAGDHVKLPVVREAGSLSLSQTPAASVGDHRRVQEVVTLPPSDIQLMPRRHRPGNSASASKTVAIAAEKGHSKSAISAFAVGAEITALLGFVLCVIVVLNELCAFDCLDNLLRDAFCLVVLHSGKRSHAKVVKECERFDRESANPLPLESPRSIVEQPVDKSLSIENPPPREIPPKIDLPSVEEAPLSLSPHLEIGYPGLIESHSFHQSPSYQRRRQALPPSYSSSSPSRSEAEETQSQRSTSDSSYSGQQRVDVGAPQIVKRLQTIEEDNAHVLSTDRRRGGLIEPVLPWGLRPPELRSNLTESTANP